MTAKRRSPSKPRAAGRGRRTGQSIVALTVQEILDEEIAKKLA